LMRYAAALLRLRKPVTSDFEEAAAKLERAVDGHPTPSGEPSPEWLAVAKMAERDAQVSGQAQPQGAPERIYLVVGEDAEGAAFSDLHDVTWCADRQGPHDIEYVLAS